MKQLNRAGGGEEEEGGSLRPVSGSRLLCLISSSRTEFPASLTVKTPKLHRNLLLIRDLVCAGWLENVPSFITAWKGTGGANGTRSLTLAVRFIPTERSVASGPGGSEPSCRLFAACRQAAAHTRSSAMCAADMRPASGGRAARLAAVTGRLQPLATFDFPNLEGELIVL